MGLFSFLFGKNNRETESCEPESKPLVQEMSESELEFRFDEIFANEFSGFVIRKNVSASELNAAAHPASKVINYLIYKGETPYLAILFVRANNYRGMNVVGTQQICEKNGIGVLRFFTHMTNDITYVTERIRNSLK